MKERKIDKVIEWIRNIKEEMSGMTTQSTPTKAGFGGSAQGGDKGPTAGYDPVMGFTKRKKKIIGLGQGSRKRWM
jgi:hypothetical protein